MGGVTGKAWMLGLLFATAPVSAADFDLPPDDQVLHVFGEPSQPILPEQFRVITWNVEKSGRAGEWVRDFKRLSARADLLLVQEAYWNDAFRWGLAEAAGLAWASVLSFEWRGLPTGISTGSRAPFDRPSWLRSPDREPVTATPKMSGTIILTLRDGRELLVINTHGLNFTVGGEFRRQMMPLLLLAKAHAGPVLLGGDFNTWSADRANWLRGEAARASLSEAVPGHEPRTRVLDRVFQRGLRVLSTHVRTDVNTSDHWPLEVELALR